MTWQLANQEPPLRLCSSKSSERCWSLPVLFSSVNYRQFQQGMNKWDERVQQNVSTAEILVAPHCIICQEKVFGDLCLELFLVVAVTTVETHWKLQRLDKFLGKLQWLDKTATWWRRDTAASCTNLLLLNATQLSASALNECFLQWKRNHLIPNVNIQMYRYRQK